MSAFKVHGGQPSLFLQVVKIPLDTINLSAFDSNILPFSRGSFLLFPNVSLLKYTSISFPKNSSVSKFPKKLLKFDILLSASLVLTFFAFNIFLSIKKRNFSALILFL